MLTVAQELQIFTNMLLFTKTQVNIVNAVDDQLDQHANDFGLTRETINGITESDSALRQRILNTFFIPRLSGFAIRDKLSPYSDNTPIVETHQSRKWFLSGTPQTDNIPFGFAGTDTIAESINLITTIQNFNASQFEMSFQVRNVALPGQYFYLPYQIQYISSNQLALNGNGMNLLGMFPPGRKIQLGFAGGSTINTTVADFNFNSNDDNILTISENFATSNVQYVLTLGDSATVAYNDPVTGLLFMWTAPIIPNGYFGTVTISDATRADTFSSNFIDYTTLNTGLISVRGLLDPMYQVEIIMSESTIKWGATTLKWGTPGLVWGQSNLNPNAVNNVLYNNLAAGVVPRVRLVPDYPVGPAEVSASPELDPKEFPEISYGDAVLNNPNTYF